MARLLDAQNELNLALDRLHGLHLISQAIVHDSDKDDGNALAILVEDIRLSLCVVKDGLAAMQDART